MSDPTPTPRPKRVLLRFEHPAEWKSRPAWRDKLDIEQHPIAEIIGGYDLHRDLWRPCGLKGCGTTHGKGYVVETADKLETHLGQDCGRKHQGVDFVELERLFHRDLYEQDRVRRLEDVLRRKDVLLAEAKRAIAACETAKKTVDAIANAIGTEPSLARVFRACARDGGALYYEREMTEAERDITREGARGADRVIRVGAGRIDGVEAATTPSPSVAIRNDVIPALLGLTAETLAASTQKQLVAASKDADAMSSALAQSRIFVALCERFVDGRNWAAFASLYEPGRLRTNDRGKRILQRLNAAPGA